MSVTQNYLEFSKLFSAIFIGLFLILSYGIRAENNADIIDHIDQVDSLNIEMITIEFADAKEVVNVLNKLLLKTGRENQDRASLNLVVNERSNSILMTVKSH